MPDPLDATSDALAAHLLARHPAAGAVGRAGLAALPGPVARRLAAHLDARVDALAPPASPWIDADHEATREATAAWRAGVCEAAQVPADAWPDALAAACREALVHLVDPAAAIARAAFADTDGPRAVADVLRVAGGFTPYPDLAQIVGEHAARKGLAQLGRAEAEALFGRVERRMCAGATPDEWAARLAPLFDLAGRVGTPAGTLPRGLLARALDARGQSPDALGDADALSADDLRDRLAAALPDATLPPAAAAPATPASPDRPEAAAPRVGADAHDWLAAATLPPTATLEPVAVPADAERAATEDRVAGPHAPDDPTRDDDRARDDDRDDDRRRDMARHVPTAHHASTEPPDDAPVPLWMRFAPPAETSPPPAPAETPLWMRFTQPESPPPAPPEAEPPAAEPPAAVPPAADDLDALEARVLGPGDAERRAWFTRELFAGDADGYHATLARLGRARSWTEASETLAADLFRTRRVSLYAEAAVAFTDLVEARFSR